MFNIIPKGNQLVQMKIEMHISFESIFTFLQKKGYKIEPFIFRYIDETFPGGATQCESHTWTATKPGQTQSEDVLFLSVFESEVKNLLKDF